jgi:hypothetical protein
LDSRSDMDIQKRERRSKKEEGRGRREDERR